MKKKKQKDLIRLYRLHCTLRNACVLGTDEGICAPNYDKSIACAKYQGT